MYNTKNYYELAETIFQTCQNLELDIFDESDFDWIFPHTTYNIRGINRKHDYYDNYIEDFIRINVEHKEYKATIDIVVNGYSYILEHDFKTNENTCSKAKLYINGMYNCLSEKDRKPVTEQTFKRALERFVKRNDIESLRNKCKAENEL